jgi:hypothetical protein
MPARSCVVWSWARNLDRLPVGYPNSVATTAGSMEGANLLNDQFGKVLAGRELLDFLPRHDDRRRICGHRLEPMNGGVAEFADVLCQAGIT